MKANIATMKKLYKSCCFFFFIVLHFISFSQTANQSVPAYTETFEYGSNMWGNGNGWSDEAISDIIKAAGGTTLRSTLPDWFVQTWGLNIRVDAFAHYSSNGMKNIVCFIEGPAPNHQDSTIYPGNTQPSKLFANLYTPIWNGDGSVNQNNYYAYYVYQLVQTYGNYIRIWEVVNEPDFTYTADVSQWLTRAPLPSETTNTLAPFYNYIRMLRITWEVVKKYYPNDFVTPGGIGYDTYLDALLRYTDNPVDGSVTPDYPYTAGAYFDMLSFHDYPTYALRYWNNSTGNFTYIRNSDYAAAEVINERNRLEAVLKKYGYDGNTYPKKYFIATETNVCRRTVDWRYGSDEMQRNFGIKALVLAQKNDIKQIHIYGVGESMDAPASPTVDASDEYKLMGLYQNLLRDAPGNQKLTDLGIAYKTTSQLLNGYTYDAVTTTNMNLPANVEGGAFVKNGNYIYVLWAKNPNDETETYSATYSFPTSWNLYLAQRMEWDNSSTGSSVQQSSQGLTLTSAPSFFILSPSALLPVTLINFTGKLENDHAVLNWSTSAEQNSSGFQVQRSSDGNNYVDIGFVNGAGNSTTVHQYSFTDNQPASINYYRLKLLDKNGQYKLSNVVILKSQTTTTAQNISVVNPFTDKIQLQLATTPLSKIEVYLYDVSGHLVGKDESPANKNVNLLFGNKLSSLSAGVYFLDVLVDQQSFRLKLAKQ